MGKRRGPTSSLFPLNRLLRPCGPRTEQGRSNFCRKGKAGYSWSVRFSFGRNPPFSRCTECQNPSWQTRCFPAWGQYESAGCHVKLHRWWRGEREKKYICKNHTPKHPFNPAHQSAEPSPSQMPPKPFWWDIITWQGRAGWLTSQGMAELVGHVPDLRERVWLEVILLQELESVLAQKLKGNAHVAVEVEPVWHEDTQAARRERHED